MNKSNKNIDFENYLRCIQPDEDWTLYFREYAEKNGIPIIRPMAENLLRQIVGIKKPKRVLEIGTAIGFSCAVIYKEMIKYTKDSYIVTIEKDTDRVYIAEENLKKYNVDANIVNDDAINVLKNLSSKKEKFDFVFLDGPKAQYIVYLPFIVDLLNNEGVLFVDNLSQDGDISKSRFQISRRNRTIHKRIREFIFEIYNHNKLYTSVLAVDDGVAICRKRDDG